MAYRMDPIEPPRPSKALPLPQRPSFEKVIENIERWANSSGLQKPK
jgi:hypothetical protein